jgi:putative protease
MKILAPVNTFESAVKLIAAGSEEIYLGGDDELFNTYSFSGRGKLGNGGIKVANGFSVTKDIVDYAHENNVCVNFTANTQFFTDGTYKGKSMEGYYIDYIESAIMAGVDSIIVGDVGLLKLINRQKYNISLHGSVFLKTVNSEQVLFLKENGVNRVTLSYHITMEEIVKLCEKKIMEYEVIGYLGCSFFNGACNFLHEYGEGVLDNFSPGVACKGLYRVKNQETSDEVRLFDVESNCAACSLVKLNQIGVDVLKIVGRDRPYQMTAEVIKFYKTVLELKQDGLENIDVPDWWKKLFCKKNSCKYNMKNPNSKFVIGG